MRMKSVRKLVLLAMLGLTAAATGSLSCRAQKGGKGADPDDFPTNSPIKHVIVIFQENVSFDHYFGTYPFAANLPGETPFHAKDDTPWVNSLLSAGLLDRNPNGVNPFRIAPKFEVTCDEDHNYEDEEFVFHGGLMDRFTSTLPFTTPPNKPFSCNDDVNLGANSVMGYYDGNTVTGLWNYAQHFAMSDNSFGTTFGPSTPGAVNLISGNTWGAALVALRPNGMPPAQEATSRMERPWAR
jgi:phospholipase C